jgi:hypothetical protein
MSAVVVTFLSENASLLISLLALLGTVNANVIAERGRRASVDAGRRADAITNIQKHSEILLEIETQNARLGTLLMIVVQKILLFQRHPELHAEYPGEYERLQNQLQALEHCRDDYVKQRSAAKSAGDSGSAIRKEVILADIKCLTIRLNEEVVKEQAQLAEAQKFAERLQTSLSRNTL